MRESRLYGFVRGALSNERPYRVKFLFRPQRRFRWSTMTLKADEYRRKANEAAAQAEAARDQQAKKIYREIAEQWRKLAEQAGKEDGKAT